MTTQVLDQAVLDDYLSDELTLQEAISFYDHWDDPRLQHMTKAEQAVAAPKLLRLREQWMRAMIADYNRDNLPVKIKDDIAKDVGRYLLDSSLKYVNRLHEMHSD